MLDTTSMLQMKLKYQLDICRVPSVSSIPSPFMPKTCIQTPPNQDHFISVSFEVTENTTTDSIWRCSTLILVGLGLELKNRFVGVSISRQYLIILHKSEAYSNRVAGPRLDFGPIGSFPTWCVVEPQRNVQFLTFKILNGEFMYPAWLSTRSM